MLYNYGYVDDLLMETSLFELCHPDDRQELRQYIQRITKNADTIKGYNEKSHALRLRNSQHSTWNYVRFRCIRTNTIADAQSVVTTLTCIATDVTDQFRRAQTTIKTFDILSSDALLVQADYTIIYDIRNDPFLHEPEDANRRCILDNIHPEDAPGFIVHFQQCKDSVGSSKQEGAARFHFSEAEDWTKMWYRLQNHIDDAELNGILIAISKYIETQDTTAV